MEAHPETIAYIRRILARPGMYAPDFDLCTIETLLHGFEAGLRAAGLLAKNAPFNRDFTEFVSETSGLSGSQGWARALINEYGAGEESYAAFRGLLELAIPDAFSNVTAAER